MDSHIRRRSLIAPLCYGSLSDFSSLGTGFPCGDALTGQVLQAFDDYDNTPDKLEHVYEERLKLLC